MHTTVTYTEIIVLLKQITVGITINLQGLLFTYING